VFGAQEGALRAGGLLLPREAESRTRGGIDAASSRASKADAKNSVMEFEADCCSQFLAHMHLIKFKSAQNMKAVLNGLKLVYILLIKRAYPLDRNVVQTLKHGSQILICLTPKGFP
jgi:hypothetical protein